MATAGEGRDSVGTIELTLTATKTIGNPGLVQGLIGVYQKSGVSGDKVPFKFLGAVYAKKRSGTGLTWTKGQKLYYRSGGPDLTAASTGNTLAGFAAEDAVAGDTYGWVYLVPISG